MNVVILSGNTGQSPTHNYTATGKLVVKFSLAVNRTYGEREADWFNVECWGKLAETMKQYGFKGQRLVVRGEMRTETYEKDGDTKYYNKVVANQIDIETWPEDEPEKPRIEWKDLPAELAQALQKVYA